MNAARVWPTAVAAVILAATLQLAVPTASAKETTFVIEMRGGPFRFVPATLQVDPGDIVTVVVFNNDTTGHTFDLPPFSVQLGTISAPVLPGTNRTATFTTSSPGTFWFFCAIPGHASQQGNSYTGMAGRLVVGQGAPPPNVTLPLIIGGVVAAAAIAVGAVVLWIRRRG